MRITEGGYIIFGVSDKPRKVIGLSNSHFDNLNQEQFTDAINSLFEPEIEWDCGTIDIDMPLQEEESETKQLKIGWIYTYEAELKPVIAQKYNESEKIVSGDVYYRYRARTQRIKHAEMMKIIDVRIIREREALLKLLEVIRKSDTANLGVVNYSNGRLSTPYGVDLLFDKKILAQVLKKAKFIHEGSFNETDGTPVLKVTGSIDLAEEVPIPEGSPDDTHPYIQKQLAEKLQISTRDLYALIWHYKMKGENKYHLEITTSKSGKIHKFSDHALKFLQIKVQELKNDPTKMEQIRSEYKNRDKEH